MIVELRLPHWLRAPFVHAKLVSAEVRVKDEVFKPRDTELRARIAEERRQIEARRGLAAGGRLIEAELVVGEPEPAAWSGARSGDSFEVPLQSRHLSSFIADTTPPNRAAAGGHVETNMRNYVCREPQPAPLNAQSGHRRKPYYAEKRLSYACCPHGAVRTDRSLAYYGADQGLCYRLMWGATPDRNP
jgi:hypothetical protein